MSNLNISSSASASGSGAVSVTAGNSHDTISINGSSSGSLSVDAGSGNNKITLSNINVYACLVCGKYYQGRGPKSHAYFHALDVGHHVYINMETQKVYVLPEGYEVKNRSLDDIKYVSDPLYTKEEVAAMDKEPRTALDLSGKPYIPGLIAPICCICRSIF